MAKKSWFKMQAKAGGKSADISIYDEIGYWGVTAKDFKQELEALGDVSEIRLSIHSPGGDVLDGWAIHNLLKNHSAKVIASIDGLAGSMATVILMAADEVSMPANAWFMIHNPWGCTWGEADEMRAYADLLDKMRDGIRDAYVAKSGQAADKIEALMKASTWLTGQEALDLGLVDEVTDALTMAALTNSVSGMKDALERAGVAVPECKAAGEDGDDVEEDAPETPEGMLAWLKKKFSGSGSGEAAPNNKALLARAESAEAEVKKQKAEISSLQAKVEKMQSETKEVFQLVAEAGFSSEEVEDLPPSGGGEKPSNVLDQYEAIEDKAERRKFYSENSAAIWREQEKRGKQ